MNHPMHRVVSFAIVGPHELEVGFEDGVVRRINFLPVLEGERLVARVDPRFDRRSGTLHIQGVWWEPGVRPTKARRAELAAAIERYGGLLGAHGVAISGGLLGAK